MLAGTHSMDSVTTSTRIHIVPGKGPLNVCVCVFAIYTHTHLTCVCVFAIYAFSALTLLVGWQEGQRPVKN